MSKYALRNNVTGAYLVSGRGFTASTLKDATRFPSTSAAVSQQSCAANLGISTSVITVPDQKSFAVNYVRSGDVEVLGSGLTKAKSNRNNPSPRRFSTKKEAVHHAVRFMEIEGHLGFYITESTEAANASINWATGKTNPVI